MCVYVYLCLYIYIYIALSFYRPRFGSVIELAGDTLLPSIDNEPSTVTVIVHIYEHVSKV